MFGVAVCGSGGTQAVASNSQITPLSVQDDVIGAVTRRETGWHEVKLTIPIHGEWPLEVHND